MRQNQKVIKFYNVQTILEIPMCLKHRTRSMLIGFFICHSNIYCGSKTQLVIDEGGVWKCKCGYRFVCSLVTPKSKRRQTTHKQVERHLTLESI